MPTLQDLCKAKKLTVKQFADVINITPYQASKILHRQDADLFWRCQDKIAALFDITVDALTDVALETDKEKERRWRTKHPPLTDEQRAAHEATIKKVDDASWEKMSEEQRKNLHTWAVKNGYGQEQRSPLDIMIDRAVGRE